MIPLLLEFVAAYALGIIVGVAALGAVLVCIAAKWKPKRVATCLLFYTFVVSSTLFLCVICFNIRVTTWLNVLLHS